MKIVDIKRAACVGGGVVGSSWAIQFATRGLTVTLYDVNDEQLKRSKTQIYKSLDVLEQFNAITLERRGEITTAIHLTTSVEEIMADAQFTQGSGPERLEVKRSILAQVEACAATDTLYASSTSGLLTSNTATKTTHSERCMGVYPYGSSRLIPLMELTSGNKIDPALLRLTYDFYQSIGKEAIFLRRECSGFIANRPQLALYREVQDLVMRRVCSTGDAGKALVYGPGLRWAIFGHNMVMQLGNLGGLTGMVNALSNSGDRRLADIAFQTHQPDNWAETARPGADEEMKYFPDHIGYTNEACAAYRDQMLIGLLKLHEKL